MRCTWHLALGNAMSFALREGLRCGGRGVLRLSTGDQQTGPALGNKGFFQNNVSSGKIAKKVAT
jgi:hypothetical protein